LTWRLRSLLLVSLLLVSRSLSRSLRFLRLSCLLVLLADTCLRSRVSRGMGFRILRSRSLVSRVWGSRSLVSLLCRPGLVSRSHRNLGFPLWASPLIRLVFAKGLSDASKTSSQVWRAERKQDFFEQQQALDFFEQQQALDFFEQQQALDFFEQQQALDFFEQQQAVHHYNDG
jgi:hypothetical protein